MKKGGNGKQHRRYRTAPQYVEYICTDDECDAGPWVDYDEAENHLSETDHTITGRPMDASDSRG